MVFGAGNPLGLGSWRPACAPCKRARRRSPSQQWQVSLHVSPLRSVPFSKSCGWPKPAGSRSAPACRLSGDTLRSFIRSAPVLRFLALSLPLICVPRAGGRGWLRPRPSLSLAHGVTGLGMLCVVAATAVSTSGLTVVGTVALMQRTCRPRLTSFSSALTVRSLGCLRPVHPPLQAALSAHIESVVSQVHPGAGQAWLSRLCSATVASSNGCTASCNVDPTLSQSPRR